MSIGQEPLREIPWRWLICWLILPNLAIMLMWPVVGVPMQAGLAMSGIFALILSQLPWRAVRAIGVSMIFVMVTTLYVSHLFAIPPLNLSLILQFLSDVRPLRSMEYIVASIVLLLIFAVTVYFAPKVPRFTSRTQFLYAALAIGVLVTLDGALAFDARKSSRFLPSSDIPVDSAVGQVGLMPETSAGRHVLLIVVEALGVPTADEEKALFDADWDRPEWRERYDVSEGSSKFFGSTTNGELRELCDRWVHYTDFDFDNADCLPSHFRDAGYHTTAMHSFVGDLFDRRSWYPKIGFDDMAFAEDFYRDGARECPGVFPGACDADIPAIVLKRLETAEQPQFLYWLTLNTHLPVVADEAMGTRPCNTGSAQWREDFPTLCRLFQLHHHLADQISEMALSPRLPPTDILIVGDHKPPMFDRTSSARFEDGTVPWIYLRARK